MKKIFENEKRLQAGDHSLDLLAHDFKKNYNMYIFPVHWQFGQLDQHPADGYVTGSRRGCDFQSKLYREKGQSANRKAYLIQFNNSIQFYLKSQFIHFLPDTLHIQRKKPERNR